MEFLRSIYEDTFGGGFFDVAPTNNFHVICKCKQNLRISAKVQRCFMLLRDLLSSSDAWCGVPLENRIGHESICCHYKGSRVPLGKSGWLPCHIFHIVICIYEKEHTLLLAFPGPPSSPATAEKKDKPFHGKFMSDVWDPIPYRIRKTICRSERRPERNMEQLFKSKLYHCLLIIMILWDGIAQFVRNRHIIAGCSAF